MRLCDASGRVCDVARLEESREVSDVQADGLGDELEHARSLYRSPRRCRGEAIQSIRGDELSKSERENVELRRALQRLEGSSRRCASKWSGRERATNFSM